MRHKVALSDWAVQISSTTKTLGILAKDHEYFSECDSSSSRVERNEHLTIARSARHFHHATHIYQSKVNFSCRNWTQDGTGDLTSRVQWLDTYICKKQWLKTSYTRVDIRRWQMNTFVQFWDQLLSQALPQDKNNMVFKLCKEFSTPSGVRPVTLSLTGNVTSHGSAKNNTWEGK